MPAVTKIQIRRGTAAQWASTNPVLDAGEMGLETDTKRFKFGDGTTTWNSLPYASSGIGAWAPNTAYAAGQQVVTATGDIVEAFEAHTSGATYNDALWSNDRMGYLTANFTYNSVEGEKLNLFYAPDGVTITGHGPNPIFAPATGLRDPSISKIGNIWYMAYGFHDPSLKQFALASSPDLVNWTIINTFNVSSIANLSQAWAPELFQNPEDGSVYIFFTSVWASGTTLEMWYVKATNVALTTWAAPVKLSWSAQPAKVMDAVFTKKGTTWYMFYGDNNYICRATATSLLGPWTADKTGDWAGWGINKEAPQIVRVGPSKWRLYIDQYNGTSPNWNYPGYGYTESSDLNTWSAYKNVIMGPDNQNNIVLRHGSFIPIKDSATDNLVRAVMDSGASTIRHAEFTTRTTVPNGAEVGVGALTLDTWSTFLEDDFNYATASQIKVGTTGVYSASFHAGIGSNNFGDTNAKQWVTIFSPTKNQVVARLVATGGYECTTSNSDIYCNAGEILEFRLTQFTGTSRVIDGRVSITRRS